MDSHRILKHCSLDKDASLKPPSVNEWTMVLPCKRKVASLPPKVVSPSTGAPRVVPVIANEDNEDSDAYTDSPFSITDLIEVIDPSTLETLMDGCGERAPAWSKLRKSLPASKSKLSFLHFTGTIKRDIDAAKIPNMANKLIVDEAFSGTTTITTYALASIIYDLRFAEIDDGPTSAGLDLICLLISTLLQECGKQCALVNMCIGKAMPGYQILVDMAVTTEENGSDCLSE
ncbi:hypothetical protein FBU31_001910 [Coemansia sp. 'formosensis']|nr:hypothetical protein FBU31_001910 [Coemansia sp. 'formosensis']